MWVRELTLNDDDEKNLSRGLSTAKDVTLKLTETEECFFILRKCLLI